MRLYGKTTPEQGNLGNSLFSMAALPGQSNTKTVDLTRWLSRLFVNWPILRYR